MKLFVHNKYVNFRAVEPFLADLYANANLEIPDEFNPITEVVRVVETLRKQGAQNENINRSTQD